MGRCPQSASPNRLALLRPASPDMHGLKLRRFRCHPMGSSEEPRQAPDAQGACELAAGSRREISPLLQWSWQATIRLDAPSPVEPRLQTPHEPYEFAGRYPSFESARYSRAIERLIRLMARMRLSAFPRQGSKPACENFAGYSYQSRRRTHDTRATQACNTNDIAPASVTSTTPAFPSTRDTSHT